MSELAALGELKQDFSHVFQGAIRLVKTNDFSLFPNEVCFAVPVVPGIWAVVFAATTDLAQDRTRVS